MSDRLPIAESEPEWAAFAAIDWADQKHAWRLVPADSAVHEQGTLENTPEAVDLWAANLCVRFGGRPIAVCLEQSRGPLVYMLSKYAQLVLFPVHPSTAARYRQVFFPSGAKDDPRDAASLLDLLLHHRSQLRTVAAGHGGDSPSAAFGRAAATHGQREDPPEQPSHRLSENVFPPNPALV